MTAMDWNSDHVLYNRWGHHNAMLKMRLLSAMLCTMLSLVQTLSPQSLITQSVEDQSSIHDVASPTQLTDTTADWLTSGNSFETTQQTTTLPKCSHAERCRNGMESGKCPVKDTCDCSLIQNGIKYFLGSTCDTLNLSVTSQVTSRRTLNITWDMIPNLIGQYYFIFRKSSTEDHDIYLEPLKQINNRTVRLVNLDAGSIDYIVCLVDKDLAKSVFDTKNTSRVDVRYQDCLLVSTQTGVVWGQQLAFYLVCACMGLILLVIFFVGCIKESLDKKNYHLFENGRDTGESEEHEVDLVDDMNADKDDTDNTCAIEGSRTDMALETV